MTDRGHTTGRPLGEADFDSSPYADLPRRKRARKSIPSGQPPPQLDAPVRRRRLSEAERRAIRERRQPPPSVADETTADPPTKATRRKVGGRALVLGGLLFVGMAAIAFGGDLLRSGSDTNLTPTATTAALLPPPPASPTAVPTVAPTPTPTPIATDAGDGRNVVCIDPGHGGWDPGWVRDANEHAPLMREADLNLAQAWDLRNRLEAHGIEVVMTRISGYAANALGEDVVGNGRTLRDSRRDGFLDDIQARINICNEANADILLSIHHNGHPDPRPNGFEVWFTAAPTRPFGDQSWRFATLVFRALGEQFEAAGYNANPRGVVPDSEADVDNPEAEEHYLLTGPAVYDNDGRLLITPSEMPAAISEALFLSNDEDAAFLATDEAHNAIVTAYENAILQYFEEFPG